MLRMLDAEGVRVAQTLVDASGQRHGELSQGVQDASGRTSRDAELADRTQHVVGYGLK